MTIIPYISIWYFVVVNIVYPYSTQQMGVNIDDPGPGTDWNVYS